jgi:hypothetical protein
VRDVHNGTRLIEEALFFFQFATQSQFLLFRSISRVVDTLAYRLEALGLCACSIRSRVSPTDAFQFL